MTLKSIDKAGVKERRVLSRSAYFHVCTSTGSSLNGRWAEVIRRTDKFNGIQSYEKLRDVYIQAADRVE